MAAAYAMQIPQGLDLLVSSLGRKSHQMHGSWVEDEDADADADDEDDEDDDDDDGDDADDDDDGDGDDDMMRWDGEDEEEDDDVEEEECGGGKPIPRPGSTLSASLRSRNAHGQVTRAIWCFVLEFSGKQPEAYENTSIKHRA